MAAPSFSRARGVGAGAGRAGLSGVPMRAPCRTRGLAREPGEASERARPVRAVGVGRARGVPARSGAAGQEPGRWALTMSSMTLRTASC